MKLKMKILRISSFLYIPILFALAVTVSGAEPVPGKEKQEDGKKVSGLFSEISKNMKLIEKMLNQKKSGKECQNQQKNLVDQIDKLIDGLQKMQKSSGQGGGKKSEQKQSGGKPQSRDQKAGEQQRKLEKQTKGKSDKQKQVKGEKKETKGKTEEEQKRGAGDPPPVDNKGGKGHKGSGGWGFLPGEVRALLRSRGRSGVPLKYAEIIRRYFERLSEAKNK